MTTLSLKLIGQNTIGVRKMKIKSVVAILALTNGISAFAGGNQAEISAVIKIASVKITSFSEIRFSKSVACSSDRSCKQFDVYGSDENGSNVNLTVSTVRPLTRPGPVNATIL